ncbi:S-adenosyl-methyltransferase MraW [Chthoniobacter flavus Ellin428]|uniref:Ribosomal RNA small subunit methyltransferase H n=1 Tax=Chthoniobacter flavus Ellin428 TaxID=497964 RepID=B4D203_9BACT|nr:S-adenosyl-methyltransferase MraW [Chthoniobacter flavus Ellin428]TCO93000.1 16S rRNA (cytosine1402-N4)-methyltransferase [Chthoniobacter flavus]
MSVCVEIPKKPRAKSRRPSLNPRPYEYHESVLLAETVERLAPAPGKVIVDGTLGGGGHTAALLAAGAQVIGFDQDPEALAFAGRKLAEFGGQFRPVHTSFAKAGEALDQLGVEKIDGAMLDLGVSSRQLDAPERGFSFMHDGPLDMRMDPTNLISAADLVNTMAGDQLEKIFRNYGEEPAARKIAAHLVRDRLVAPFRTTLQLAQAVERVVPRHSRTHPATRVFQALRIAVNRELEALTLGLEQFSQRLAPGGRLAIITFHSLEDRIVKVFFKERAAAFIDRPEWPEARPNPIHIFKAITGKPVVASDAEQRANPRSRSAKLRVVERIPYVR